MMFCNVGLVTTAFSVHLPYIISLNGLTNAQGSAIITVRSISAMVFLSAADKVIKKLDIRLCSVLVLLLNAAAFAVFAFSETFPAYCIGGVLAGAVMSLGGTMLLSVIISRWFKKRVAFALGICSAGTGLSTIIIPVMATAIIECYSLKAAFLTEMGIIILAAAAAAAVIRKTPAQIGAEPYDLAKDAAKQNENFEPRGNLERPAYKILLWAVFFVLGAATAVPTGHYANLFTSYGFSSSLTAALVSFSGITLIIGKCIFGLYTDRFGSRSAFLLFPIICFTGLLAVCFASNNVYLAYAGVGIAGFGLPISTTGISVAAREFSTPESYARSIKGVQLSMNIGMLLFSLVPGLLADSFGGYRISFIICTALTAVFTVLMQAVYFASGKKKRAGKFIHD